MTQRPRAITRTPAGAGLPIALAIAAALCACTREAPPSTNATPAASADGATHSPNAPLSASASGAAHSPNAPLSASAATRTEPTLVVTDAQALAVLSEAGADFARLLVARAEPAASNAALWSSPAYRSLVDPIAHAVQAIAKSDESAGVGIRGNAHRLFDVRWLSSPTARFELVAVVNRSDRRPFDPKSCGETRLLYRLAYDQRTGAVHLASRLPMTLIAELRAGDASEPEGCARAARRWYAPSGLTGRALGAWLSSSEGPLGPALLSRERLVQLSVNVQTVRWPSAVRPDLGGHAEYVLRAFGWDAATSRYVPRKLENTPDVVRIARDPALKARLRQWIAEPGHLVSLDRATARLPDEFLAESVVSVTPRGFARHKNRPYRSLFAPEEFAALDLSKLRFARSPEALVRRLDDLTCNGCHQSRSIAGFHLVGEDPQDATAGNALATGFSPHTLRDLARRRAYVASVASGAAADDARPFAERAGPDDDGYGAHCGLGDPGFSSWTCAPGLRCDPYEAAAGDNTVGTCMPSSLAVGDPCEPSRVKPNTDPYRDRAERAPQRPCDGDGVCEQNRVGFPGGMCASSCDALPSDAACGGIAVLTPFNDCLAQQRPFGECVQKHVRPAGLRACGEHKPCRDDYICARAAVGGVCLPPYFVFQMRVDGHP